MTPTGRSVISMETAIAVFAVGAILVYLILRFGFGVTERFYGIQWIDVPLLAALVIGGVPLILGLLADVVRFQFGADFLAGISIVTAAILGEYLAGTVVVLMLSGGQALEAYAVRSASSVLQALARRMPSIAHRKVDQTIDDVSLGDLAIDDLVVIFPHEICPVDGVVVEGHGSMDESYLTGEPYIMSKVPGTSVLSGAINGESTLAVRAEKLPVDSRYAKIMQVMRDSEQRRPQMRRLGDQLGAIYTPVAVGLALLSWAISGEAIRFLAVLVVATPCPLLIAIPVAIIGSVSLAARRGIIIKDPTVLEKVGTCTTAMFDKTGTLTYGEPRLTEIEPVDGYSEQEILAILASLERYSRHPLAEAVLRAANDAGVPMPEAREVSEQPGEGLRGAIDGKHIQVTSRKKLKIQHPELADSVPQYTGGMECLVIIDDALAGLCRFRDEPRSEGTPFIQHLSRRHGFKRVLLVSGDRESEVRYLADRVGIANVYASQSPEEKLALVRDETSRANTVFLGDGINDAPALTAATVGVAFGQGSDITTEAAGAVVLDNSLQRVDELLHIGKHMRSIALQSAVGGMVLSLVGMLAAAAGLLPPVAGAITQEVIDVVAVVNALRVAIPPRVLSDYESPPD